MLSALVINSDLQNNHTSTGCRLDFKKKGEGVILNEVRQASSAKI